jgi:hypothetical protein
MSGIGLQIDVRSAEVDQLVSRLLDGLTDLTPLNEQVGIRTTERTRNHLVAIAQTRHATATRLGATPSGHWGQAAEKTSFQANQEGAIISIEQPGIGRVAHDVTIEPGPGKKYLTLPAIAAAYNQRAYRISGLHVMVRFLEGERRAVALAMDSGEGKDRVETVWYWLVTSVTQKQDRTLLPSDEEYNLAALAGVRDFVDRLLAA